MEENVEELLKKTFLKLRSDYGFKRAFASEEHKDGLLHIILRFPSGREGENHTDSVRFIS